MDVSECTCECVGVRCGGDLGGGRLGSWGQAGVELGECQCCSEDPMPASHPSVQEGVIQVRDLVLFSLRERSWRESRGKLVLP